MDIPDLISSLDNVQRINDMQVQQEAYYNFVNSIDSESTKKIYEYWMSYINGNRSRPWMF